MSNHEVISAFVDDEPFDSDELATALADPAGRELLIDILALRHLTEPEEDVTGRAAPPLDIDRPSNLRRSKWWTAAAAAAVVAALGGGYEAGRRVEVSTRADRPSQQIPKDAGPPAPTIVVRLGADQTWQPIQKGSSR